LARINLKLNRHLADELDSFCEVHRIWLANVLEDGIVTRTRVRNYLVDSAIADLNGNSLSAIVSEGVRSFGDRTISINPSTNVRNSVNGFVPLVKDKLRDMQEEYASSLASSSRNVLYAGLLSIGLNETKESIRGGGDIV